jgi:UDP-2,3-diacylglucosamine hydrolase
MNAGAVPASRGRELASSFALLQAPAHWRRVDFIADLHLHGSDGATFLAWQDYMQRTQADAVFILGDLFEVWVGDDVLNDQILHGTDPGSGQEPGFEVRCAQVLKAASRRLSVYFMHGNRDFLLGPVYAGVSGMTLLDDPTVLDFAGQRWLLSHGDSLCLDDTAYMEFRAQVRSVTWRQEFLARSLTERQLVGRALRVQSEARKRDDRVAGAALVDLDSDATRYWLGLADCRILIHGHTHKPTEHDLGNGQGRFVLSDWEGSASPVRASVLRISARPLDQASVERLAATFA